MARNDGRRTVAEPTMESTSVCFVRNATITTSGDINVFEIPMMLLH